MRLLHLAVEVERVGEACVQKLDELYAVVLAHVVARRKHGACSSLRSHWVSFAWRGMAAELPCLSRTLSAKGRNRDAAAARASARAPTEAEAHAAARCNAAEHPWTTPFRHRGPWSWSLERARVH